MQRSDHERAGLDSVLSTLTGTLPQNGVILSDHPHFAQLRLSPGPVPCAPAWLAGGLPPEPLDHLLPQKAGCHRKTPAIEAWPIANMLLHDIRPESGRPAARSDLAIGIAMSLLQPGTLPTASGNASLCSIASRLGGQAIDVFGELLKPNPTRFDELVLELRRRS